MPGLEHIEGLKNLKILRLGNRDHGMIRRIKPVRVTDSGLKHLKGLAQLEQLILDHTGVTDAGLEHLKGLKNLKSLWIPGGQVSEDGLEKLREALPNCNIDAVDYIS